MKPLNLTARLIAAAAAATTTLALFSAVISISEPQLSVLVAKNQRMDKLPSASTSVALASRAAADGGK